ncbi:hypothetical protein [Agromyces sp. Soil535]|uniref:hypothetical protein n=1 Tax=Agromyces sp. Soil535 TaxID=1736390 RepID=UPI000AC24964|nr:hypothetical protein [Agromyces sp. Soil535]
MTRLPKNTPVPDADEPGPGGRAADRLSEFERARGLTDDEQASDVERADGEQVPGDGTIEDESTGVATGDADDSAEESTEPTAGDEPAPDRNDRPDEGEVAPV